MDHKELVRYNVINASIIILTCTYDMFFDTLDNHVSSIQ